MKNLLPELNSLGRVWIREALTEAELLEIEDRSKVSGLSSRRLTFLPRQIRERLETMISVYLHGAKIVRLTTFNKSANQNWALPWHQDRVIAVKARVELPGYTNWTRKENYWHYEPPQSILEGMLFARLYLDDTDGAGGDMQVALGSHNYGKVMAKDIVQRVKSCAVETCEGLRSDLLLVKVLTLHRSSKMPSPRPRRILRIDFSPHTLPKPLEWAIICD